MMEPYEHRDEDGDVMMIAELDGKPGVALVRARHGAEVTAKDLPVITGKLYEACGLPSPVMLDRADFPQDGHGKWRPFPGSSLTAERFGRQVRVSFDTANGAASSFPPAKAREMAAALIVLADEAEAEPDPAEVEELAEAIHRDREHCEGAGALDRQSAAAALRWMNSRGICDE